MYFLVTCSDSFIFKQDKSTNNVFCFVCLGSLLVLFFIFLITSILRHEYMNSRVIRLGFITLFTTIFIVWNIFIYFLSKEINIDNIIKNYRVKSDVLLAISKKLQIIVDKFYNDLKDVNKISINNNLVIKMIQNYQSDINNNLYNTLLNSYNEDKTKLLNLANKYNSLNNQNNLIESNIINLESQIQPYIINQNFLNLIRQNSLIYTDQNIKSISQDIYQNYKNIRNNLYLNNFNNSLQINNKNIALNDQQDEINSYYNNIIFNKNLSKEINDVQDNIINTDNNNQIQEAPVAICNKIIESEVITNNNGIIYINKNPILNINQINSSQIIQSGEVSIIVLSQDFIICIENLINIYFFYKGNLILLKLSNEPIISKNYLSYIQEFYKMNIYSNKTQNICDEIPVYVNINNNNNTINLNLNLVCFSIDDNSLYFAIQDNIMNITIANGKNKFNYKIINNNISISDSDFSSADNNINLNQYYI